MLSIEEHDGEITFVYGNRDSGFMRQRINLDDITYVRCGNERIPDGSATVEVDTVAGRLLYKFPGQEEAEQFVAQIQSRVKGDAGACRMIKSYEPSPPAAKAPAS